MGAIQAMDGAERVGIEMIILNTYLEVSNMPRFTNMALAIVDLERIRQEKLKVEGRFRHTPADKSMNEAEKLAMIIEEIGEVSEHVLKRVYLTYDDKGSMEDSEIITELSHVAALSIAWMECLLEKGNKEGIDIPSYKAPTAWTDDSAETLDAAAEQSEQALETWKGSGFEVSCPVCHAPRDVSCSDGLGFHSARTLLAKSQWEALQPKR